MPSHRGDRQGCAAREQRGNLPTTPILGQNFQGRQTCWPSPLSWERVGMPQRLEKPLPSRRSPRDSLLLSRGPDVMNDRKPGGRTQQKLFSLMLPEARRLKSSRAAPPLKALGGDLSSPLPSFCWLPAMAFPGFWPHHCNLSAHGHGCLSSLCVALFSHKETSH